ncbi:hypothetical protein ACFT5B_07610 [Luteimicrobium sp. NPDC057192]|uniref:hypothetical protein n=1 Tax=Luteimicrobium sp. NPDC057192 TaxID=3346042 RepID=UPI00362D4DE6
MSRGGRPRRLVRAALAAGVLATTALAPTGCYSCSMPADTPPAVDVDARAWFVTHPGRSAWVSACIETTCEDIERTSSGTPVTVPRGTADAAQDLVVTLRADGHSSVEHLTVTLGTTSTHGPCGTFSHRGRVVEVGADGTLTAGGVLPTPDAVQTRRASTTSSPTPSPTG